MRTESGDIDLQPWRHKLLIVEDDHLIALDAESVLRQAGFQVVGIAGSAAVALEMARQRRPDLAIMDIRLAGSPDGVETAIELAQADIRCLFATAHGDPATRQRAAAAMPLGWPLNWVVKPYRADALVQAVTDALRAMS